MSGADAEILVALAERHRPSASYERAIRKALREDLPSEVLYFQAADIVSRVLNFGLSSPIDVQIESRDWQKALPVALRLERALAAIPGTEDVRLAQVLDRPTLDVRVDRSRTAELGLSERDAASALLTSLSSSSLPARRHRRE